MKVLSAPPANIAPPLPLDFILLLVSVELYILTLAPHPYTAPPELLPESPKATLLSNIELVIVAWLL